MSLLLFIFILFVSFIIFLQVEIALLCSFFILSLFYWFSLYLFRCDIYFVNISISWLIYFVCFVATCIYFVVTSLFRFTYILRCGIDSSCFFLVLCLYIVSHSLLRSFYISVILLRFFFTSRLHIRVCDVDLHQPVLLMHLIHSYVLFMLLPFFIHFFYVSFV